MATNKLTRQVNTVFEQIRRIDENGLEYWSARDLSKVLEYSEYRHFLPVVARAKEACQNSGHPISDHFEDVLVMVPLGSGAERQVESIKLSRYACYLIVQNADPSKEVVASAKHYFSEKQTMIRKMSVKDELTDFLLYTTPNGKVKVEAILANETVWLTQEQMSQVFGVQVPAISKHLKNVFESGELKENTSLSILETHLPDGRIFNINYYNLDAIISVGYRVNSSLATQFRIWATNTLKEYIIKGFVMDDYRLKNGQYFGKDYFEELLERVRSIRASERRIYQKITDIFAECSIDYDKNSPIAQEFYAEVQNKFHYAITGQTAAEIIYTQANAEKEFMGLKTWKNAPKGRVLKSDVTIAKNYLKQNEIQKLERTITSFFDYIERIIENRTTFTMSDFAASVVKFLEFNEYRVLEDKGKISRKQADEKAINEYAVFNKRQAIESDFDRIIKKLETKQ
jgi:hypothetical protein